VKPAEPTEIIWSPLARARLQEIRAYVAKDKPIAAERLAIRIVAVIEALRNHPHLGHTGTEPGIRELIIGGTPYIEMYRVRGKRVTILTIGRAAQRKTR
jgi:plasmid stabilization system protein ParE